MSVYVWRILGGIICGIIRRLFDT